MAGWEHGKLKALDRFADICVEYAEDNDGFVMALGKEYGVRSDMGAVDAFRGILATIAEEVSDELSGGEEE